MDRLNRTDASYNSKKIDAGEKVSARAKKSKNFAKSSKKLSVGADFDEKQKIDVHMGRDGMRWDGIDGLGWDGTGLDG